MFTNRATLLACAAATMLWAQPALAQDFDTPISTAPPEFAGSEVPDTAPPAPIELAGPGLYAPWPEYRPKDRTCRSEQSITIQRGRELHNVNVAPGELVNVNTSELSCAQFGGRSAIEFGTTMLVANGNLGRSIADEVRFGVSHEREVTLPLLGPVMVEGWASIRAYGAVYGFDQISDDYSTLGVRLSRKVRVGSWTFEPCYWHEKWNPMNNMNSQAFWATCLAVDQTKVTILGGTPYAYIENKKGNNSTTAQLNKNLTLADAGLRWRLPYDLMLAVGVRYNRYGKSDSQRDLCVARDARIYFCSDVRGKGVAFAQFDPFFTIVRRTTF